MRSDLREAARALKPGPFQEYLRSRGWTLTSEPNGFVLYRRGEVEVDVPSLPELGEYAKRVLEALEVVAAVEDVEVGTLLEQITAPVGDTLAVRLATAKTSHGTVPLGHSLRVREATKDLILAAAHSTIAPLPYFARMSRREAVALVDSVHEAQTRRGSFVSRFIVPVEPTVGEDQAFDPFGRRVVTRLMTALERVRHVRALGAYEDLLAEEKNGVSANLLAALATLTPVVEGGELDISVAWSRNRAVPAGVSRVALPAESLQGLDAVAEAMRHRAQTTGFEVEGYVTRLDRDHEATEGDVVIVPRDGVELRQVHVHLDRAAYAKAVQAHAAGSPVRVVGTLSKAGRRWSLSDATGFDLAADADAEVSLLPPK